MRKLIDLHTHSSASDGTLSPKDLVAYAKEKGLTAIAVTDHDTLAGVKEAVEEGKRIGVEIVAGVEISTEDKFKIHIVGLGINIEEQCENELFKRLKVLEEEREERLYKIIDRLNIIGIDVSASDVKKFCPTGIIAKPHIARAIIEKGYEKTVKDACAKYLEKGCPAYVGRKKPTVKEAVNLIKMAGGIPIFAHPGKLLKKLSYVELENEILRLKSYGCEGIEVFYSDYDQETEGKLMEIALRHDLIMSGGSDFHGGNVKPHIDLGVGCGNLQVPYEFLQNIKYAAAKKPNIK